MWKHKFLSKNKNKKLQRPVGLQYPEMGKYYLLVLITLSLSYPFIFNDL